MQKFFTPKHVAVIGTSRKKDKIGRIIFDQLAKEFSTYPVNPNLKRVGSHKVYSSVLDIPYKIDTAFIAVPAAHVINAVEECGNKGIKNIVIISSGFKEVGNLKLEHDLELVLKKYNIKCVGPNCLGIFDAHSKLDSLFLPVKKLPRPDKGSISFVTQSGAVGSAVLDLLAYENFGFAKFISYGNATNLTETDFLEYLGKDRQTKVICMYIEAITNGKRFLKVAKKIKKPIIVIKGGKSIKGGKATLSHTGSLAGSWEIYQGAFKQCGIILADTVEEMFDIAKLFEKLPTPKGNKVQVITNGGGYGIITVDSMVEQDLQLAKMTPSSRSFLKHHVPKIVTIANPIDLVGDATNKRYDLTLKISMTDSNVDLILMILLHQTPGIDENIIKVLQKHKKKKPLTLISTGGLQTKILSKKIEKIGFPVFSFPEPATKAIKKWLTYYKL